MLSCPFFLHFTSSLYHFKAFSLISSVVRRPAYFSSGHAKGASLSEAPVKMIYARFRLLILLTIQDNVKLIAK